MSSIENTINPSHRGGSNHHPPERLVQRASRVRSPACSVMLVILMLLVFTIAFTCLLTLGPIVKPVDAPPILSNETVVFI